MNSFGVPVCGLQASCAIARRTRAVSWERCRRQRCSERRLSTLRARDSSSLALRAGFVRWYSRLVFCAGAPEKARSRSEAELRDRRRDHCSGGRVVALGASERLGAAAEAAEPVGPFTCVNVPPFRSLFTLHPGLVCAFSRTRLRLRRDSFALRLGLVYSSSSALALDFGAFAAALGPSFASRTFLRISSKSSAFSLRNALAVSRPWPRRTSP